MKDAKVQFLKDELNQRVAANNQYSMRSFAQFLGINVGTLSSIINGQRRLSPKAAEKFCECLGYSPDQQQKVLNQLDRNIDIDKDKKDKSAKGLKKALLDERAKLDQEIFHLISDWYNYAILQLVRLDAYGSSSHHKTSKWFASQLKISETQVKLALDRLVQLGLLIKNKNGFFERTARKFTTDQKSKTRPALMKWQKQLREKAIESMEQDDISKRSMTSITMAIDPEKIKLAKQKIELFQEELSELLESDNKKQVYQMTVSLFPLQKEGL